MNVIEAKFSQLRGQLESIAFLVSKGGREQQAHSELVRALIALAEIESLCSSSRLDTSASDNFVTEEKSVRNPSSQLNTNASEAEQKRVRNRLKLWARRQYQINARILNAFLRLKNSGVRMITVDDLKRELPDVESFDSNFVQMKMIAKNNHGKIFEQDGAVVAIWAPVLPYVMDYEQATKSVT